MANSDNVCVSEWDSVINRKMSDFSIFHTYRHILSDSDTHALSELAINMSTEAMWSIVSFKYDLIQVESDTIKNEQPGAGPDLVKVAELSVFYDFHILAIFDRHTLSELAINMFYQSYVIYSKL